ncbi:MAG: hypothetical protein M1817_003390 [Caeruleum heppii]|nr:MAG: hypothetical protein M1817_003390 [Caeruleum heppii]
MSSLALDDRVSGTRKLNTRHPVSPATQAIHADDHLSSSQDVAPPMHLSTTFRYSNKPEDLKPSDGNEVESSEDHVYSRITAPNTTRLEAILSSLLNGRALTYSSGLSALHAAYVYLNPKRVSIGDGYHGSHGVVGLHQKLTGLKKLPLDCPAEDLGEGDLIHLETPLNPTGEALHIQHYADKAHSRGAYLIVDATFGPPGLQDPFLWGADMIMHSGTKYFGGHSDMLCGVLCVPKARGEWYAGLWEERGFLGSVLGSMEGWLGLRSVRTLELRVRRQSENATMLVKWLDALLHPERQLTMAAEDASLSSGNSAMARKVLDRVAHASLQTEDIAGWLGRQMPDGYGPVFAIWMKSEELAKWLPSKLALFHHATSLGGVESLIEWRAMSDAGCDRRLVRVSVGVENWTDLRDDLMDAFEELSQEALDPST